MRPVFPLSMSDFKPGDKEYCVQDKTLADRLEKGGLRPFAGDLRRELQRALSMPQDAVPYPDT